MSEFAVTFTGVITEIRDPISSGYRAITVSKERFEWFEGMWSIDMELPRIEYEPKIGDAVSIRITTPSWKLEYKIKSGPWLESPNIETATLHRWLCWV